MFRVLASLLAAGIIAVSAACGPDEPLKVDTIQLGRSLNPDNSVASHTSTFKPNETVYVAILTTAPGAGTVGVRWIYQGKVIDEPQRQVSYREARATEFHLVNAGGFPPGAYSVEVFIDGKPVGSRNFRVDH
jgi:hypothetical protein